MTEPIEKKTAAFTQIGLSGLNRYPGSGIIEEEFLSELRGRRGIKVFTEMWHNDPIISAMIFAIDMFMRRTKWHMQPADDSAKAEADAQFVEECRQDMSHTWADLISEINSMLPYGWSYFELVYKRRNGKKVNSLGDADSKFTDNKIGWRKIEIRSQSSFYQWEFDEDGSIAGMTQMAAPDYTTRTIPIEKALLFRTTSRKNSPEGVSVLRSAYRPWYFKKRIEEIEGVGVERDLAGLPFATVPAQMLSPNASEQQKAVLSAIQTMVKNVRRDQIEGVIWPMEYDEQGKPLYDFKLLNSGGTRQFETNTIITRYEQRMAMSVLADFILLGNDSSGSFALGVSKASMFQSALAAWLDGIEDVFNNYAIPRLFRLNGMEGPYPKLRHEEVQKPALQDISVFLSALAGAGAQLFPDVELENSLREMASLPLREAAQDDKDKEDKLRETTMDSNIASAKAAMEAARKGQVPGQSQTGANLPGVQPFGKQPGSVPGAPTPSTGPVKSKLPPTQRRNTIGVKASQNVSQ
jgi:hypothetical protein